MDIVFTLMDNSVSKEYSPQPASSVVPSWYKNTESYMGGEKKPSGNGGTKATIKRCMPVFDSFSAGYIIFSVSDVWVTQKEDGPWFEWASNNLISFHSVEQAPIHPFRNGLKAYPKWMNPWGIKTPKGYSVLFTQPVHRESSFKILDGVVDTDMYTQPVNFPFVLTDPNFEGLIPAGTPIAQVIPFKRDSWEMKFGGEEEVKEAFDKDTLIFSKFYDKYKNMFRAKKEYK
jgi:hypothetical protein